MDRLGSVLRVRKERVDRTKFAFKDLQPLTVHLNGKVSKREVSEDREYTMDLWFAKPGDIVVAKIDLKSGAVGIVPTDWENVAVTGHFAVYEPVHERMLPDFFHLIIQAPFFKAHLWRNKVGAEGRKEVKLDFFESELIPVPPLATQQGIVDYWRKSQDGVNAASSQYATVSRELDVWLHAHTDTQAFSGPSLKVGWDSLQNWTVQSARAAVFRQTNPKFVPFGHYAEEATEMVKPSAEPDHDWPVYGVNNKDGVFFSHHQKGEEFNSPYKRIRKDWFFHNPTRSAVGSLGHVLEVPSDAITSPEYQVWKLRDLGEASLLPAFVATLIQTPWFVKVIQFHRVGAVKQRLYVENLLSMPVPVFPRALQEHVTAARERIAEERAAAAKLAADTAREVEEMILGQRPAPQTATH
jgi:hypothetical protein